MRHNWFLALYFQPQPEIQDKQACFLLWFQHVCFLYELEIGHTITTVKTFQNLKQGVIGGSSWKHRGLGKPCEQAAPSLLSANLGPEHDLHQKHRSLTLTQTSCLGSPKLSELGWSKLEHLPNCKGQPAQAEISILLFWQPLGCPPPSPLGHAAWSCHGWVPMYSGNQTATGRGGQPVCQHVWKMAGGEAGPCAEGKEPPARARARLGRTCWLSRERKRRSGCWKEGRRKGGFPQAGEEVFREEKGATPHRFVRREAAHWWEVERLLRAGRDVWERPVPHWGRQGRAEAPNCKAGDKKQGRVY